jgi:hypothetical protein
VPVFSISPPITRTQITLVCFFFRPGYGGRLRNYSMKETLLLYDDIIYDGLIYFNSYLNYGLLRCGLTVRKGYTKLHFTR